MTGDRGARALSWRSAADLARESAEILLPAISEGWPLTVRRASEPLRRTNRFLWFVPTSSPQLLPTANLETIAEALAIPEGETCK
jgi:hypothetical protein